MVDEGATETGVTDNGVPDVRMNDKGVAETPITYNTYRFVAICFAFLYTATLERSQSL
jgi:hypothetical protein